MATPEHELREVPQTGRKGRIGQAGVDGVEDQLHRELRLLWHYGASATMAARLPWWRVPRRDTHDRL